MRSGIILLRGVFVRSGAGPYKNVNLKLLRMGTLLLFLSVITGFVSSEQDCPMGFRRRVDKYGK